MANTLIAIPVDRQLFIDRLLAILFQMLAYSYFLAFLLIYASQPLRI